MLFAELKVVAPSVFVVEKSVKPPPPPLIVNEQNTKAWDESNLMQAKANEPLDLVTLHLDHPNATTRIGTRLSPKYRGALKELLIEHMDVFAWSYEDMPCIDNAIMKHRLCVDPVA
ncbi:hypothetical protein I3760_14G098600 [Carya illinoinensis]|nr:hypothetical protein I3760_14G098600 [Carya illinoinensis]